MNRISSRTANCRKIPDANSDALYDKLLDDLGKQLAGSFHNYKELKRQPETVGGVSSRAALFQADFNDPGQTMIWGKTIVVHPAGYVEQIQQIAEGGGGALDPDTVMSLGSYRAALHAAGGACALVDADNGGRDAGEAKGAWVFDDIRDHWIGIGWTAKRCLKFWHRIHMIIMVMRHPTGRHGGDFMLDR